MAIQMNEAQFVCAAKVIGYSNLIIQSRNINGNVKRSIIDACADVMATIRGMNEEQLGIVEKKYAKLAQDILGMDGLDEDEVKQLQEVNNTIQTIGGLIGE